MSEDLNDEIQAIRSIYGDQVVRNVHAGVFNLSIPQSATSLRIFFPVDYPASSPQILGTETIGDSSKKGYGKRIVDLAASTLHRVFTPGSVCLFDLLQELEASHVSDSEEQESLSSQGPQSNLESKQHITPVLSPALDEEPRWITSAPVTEKKSTFLARVCSVKAPQQAKACVIHLLETDKRAAKATHNITAYRIRSAANAGSTSKITYQDCNDDGETAAGGRLLHLLQVMDVWDILVVVSRWYGGVRLGPDRFSIINNVAREAIVAGEWTKG